MDPFGPNGVHSNRAHRDRLDMMQQERIIDPNTRVKRYHWRAVMTPMMMKYWVPLVVVFGTALALSGRMTEEARMKRAEIIRTTYGERAVMQPSPDGMPQSMRSQYIREHLDRVIDGEDTFEVAKELQHRYKMDQRKLKRTVPTGASKMTQQTQTPTQANSPLKR